VTIRPCTVDAQGRIVTGWRTQSIPSTLSTVIPAKAGIQ